VKRTNILAALLVTVSLISTGCGTSDYVQSVTLTSTGPSSGNFYNLSGADGTLQLTANANYHSGKVVNVTDEVTYEFTEVGVDAGGNALPAPAAPVPGQTGTGTVWVYPTGLMSAIASICTWEDLPSGTPPVLPTPPEYNWLYTGYYQTQANYKGMLSQPLAVGVGSAAGNAPDGSCGPH